MMVTVITIAYNHEPYIRECLEGIVSQRTTFPFELLIHDDASTDRTADIIREYEAKYPDIVKPIYQTENQYSRGVPIGHTFLYPRAQGKYIAECEGDDYWTDPLKLQKQVDFLESHPDYGMVSSRAEIYYHDNKCFAQKPLGNPYVAFEDLLTKPYSIPTASLLYRRDIHKQYLQTINPQERGWMMGDLPMSLYFAWNSKIFYLDEITCVYRILNNSASHFSNYEKALRFVDSAYACKNFYCRISGIQLEHAIMSQYYKEVFRISYMYDNYEVSKIVSRKMGVSGIKELMYRLITTSKLFYEIARKIRRV